MNDFESRGVTEADILNNYNKYTLDGELIMNTKVNGISLLIGSYQVVLIETVGDRELDAVMAGVFA